MAKADVQSPELNQTLEAAIGPASFLTLLQKEILDLVMSVRFIVLLMLCVLLIPLSLYVNAQTYERWLADYNEQLKIESALRGSRGGWSGTRPPSPLAVFANGIETSLPKGFSIQPNQIQMDKPRSYGDPIYEVFGRIDFLFVVQAVLSLIAFLFAFDAISGEKEMGTLRLCLANAVPRYKILLGKFTGGMLTLAVPFLIATGLGLIILTATGYPLFDQNLGTKVLLMVITSIVYIGTFYLLGMLISSLSHQSKTTLIVLMLIWVVLVLAVPRLSIIVAGMIRPVESDAVIALRKKLLVENIQKEKGRALKDLYFEKARQEGLAEGALTFDANDPEFVRRRNEIAKPFEARMRDELAKIDEDHQRKKQRQLRLARNIARISPASVFAYVMTDMADTGETVKMRFFDAVRRHYDRVDRLVFSRMYQDLIMDEGHYWRFGGTLPGEERPEEPPRFEFRFPEISESLAHSLPDVALLVIYALFFFIATHMAFIRYDVR